MARSDQGWLVHFHHRALGHPHLLAVATKNDPVRRRQTAMVVGDTRHLQSMDAHAMMMVMLVAVRRTVVTMTRVMAAGIDIAGVVHPVSDMAVIVVPGVAVHLHRFKGRAARALGRQPAKQAKLDHQTQE